jgi:hypothetical protein
MDPQLIGVGSSSFLLREFSHSPSCSARRLAEHNALNNWMIRPACMHTFLLSKARGSSSLVTLSFKSYLQP